MTNQWDPAWRWLGKNYTQVRDWGCELEFLGSHPRSSSPRGVPALDIRVGTTRDSFSLPWSPPWLQRWSQQRAGTSNLKPSKWVIFGGP